MKTTKNRPRPELTAREVETANRRLDYLEARLADAIHSVRRLKWKVNLPTYTIAQTRRQVANLVTELANFPRHAGRIID